MKIELWSGIVGFVNLKAFFIMSRHWKSSALLNPYYYVTVCGFTFEFSDLEHMETVKNWFAQKVHPSTRLPDEPWLRCEHDCAQRWHERLPAKIKKGSKRARVIKALGKALEDFKKEDLSDKCC